MTKRRKAVTLQNSQSTMPFKSYEEAAQWLHDNGYSSTVGAAKTGLSGCTHGRLKHYAGFTIDADIINHTKIVY